MWGHGSYCKIVEHETSEWLRQVFAVARCTTMHSSLTICWFFGPGRRNGSETFLPKSVKSEASCSIISLHVQVRSFFFKRAVCFQGPTTVTELTASKWKVVFRFLKFYTKAAHKRYLERIWGSPNPINRLLSLTGRTSAKRIQKLSFRPSWIHNIFGCCHFHQVTVLTESSDHFLETSIETPEVCGMEVLSQGPQWISLYLNDKGMQKWCPPNSLIEKSYLPRLKLTGTYLGTTNLLGNSHLVRFCLHAFSGCKAWVQLPFFGPI